MLSYKVCNVVVILSVHLSSQPAAAQTAGYCSLQAPRISDIHEGQAFLSFQKQSLKDYIHISTLLLRIIISFFSDVKWCIKSNYSTRHIHLTHTAFSISNVDSSWYFNCSTQIHKNQSTLPQRISNDINEEGQNIKDKLTKYWWFYY